MMIPGWALAKNELWMPEDDLPLTPQQVEGPFYPETTIEQQLYNDTDLRQKLGNHEFAKGQSVVVEGAIKNQKGEPVNEAIVEVWQACSTGRYNHSRDDKNPSLLDNNFQFWGRVITGQDGRYQFLTIVPGKYPGRTARHIHFRIDANGYRRSTTQCYFSEFGEDNLRDGLYRRLDRKGRDLVTVELDKPSDANNDDASSNSNQAKSKKANAANEQARTADKSEPRQKTAKSKKTTIEQPWRGTFDIVIAKS